MEIEGVTSTVSPCGNFSFVDVINIPHPYTIGPRHVAWAADHFSGRLSESAIIDAESKGRAHCYHPHCSLLYREHEKGLLIGCKEHFKDADDHLVESLRQWLIAVTPEIEKAGYAGFAFRDDREVKEADV